MAELESMRERFIRDHVRIAEIASDAISIFDKPSPPDALNLRNARWAYASALMRHLAIKERHLYAKLERDARPEVAGAFASSKADLLGLFAQYTDYVETWPTEKALSSWSTYRIKATALVNAFTQRLKNEERDLFGLIDRFGIDIETPSPVTLNWMRQAFEVKDKIEDR